ncbi:MAG: glycosyltransferase family 4 protein [Bacteroidales bacterium]|nr:glycosyltransferase family 4 protein [Bacteroidales bacterium]
MNILFMSSSFSGGGITSFAHEVANAYSQDNEFSIILGSDSKEPIINDRVKKYYYDCTKFSVKTAKQIINLINNEICPDVIIGSNAKVLPVIAQFLNDNISIITVSHSLKYTEADVAAMAYRYCDHIIAGSVYNLDYMARKFGIKNRDKIKVVYNFVKDFPNKNEALERKIKDDVPSIVFVGGCAPSKTPELVVQIIRKLLKTDKKFKFTWVGRTNIHLSRHFPLLQINDVKQLIPKDSRVTFAGRLPTREDVENVLASANILLAPSRREGCPMAFLEAIRVGVIGVVADYPNCNRELVEKGGFGFVLPHTEVDAFVNQIIEICNNPQDYSDLYDKSYSTFINELNFDTWKSRMDSLIYSKEKSHKTRCTKVSTLRLYIHSFRLRLLSFESKVKLTLFEDFNVLFKMWRLKHREIL